jgi:hypothetical protein
MQISSFSLVNGKRVLVLAFGCFGNADEGKHRSQK